MQNKLYTTHTHTHTHTGRISHIIHTHTHTHTQGAAAIARKLALDFSPALIGFEVKAGRAFPVIHGIIIGLGSRV